MKHFAFLTAVLVVLGLARPTQADTIQLAWNANTEANLAGYVVSYGTAAKTYTSTFDSGNNTSQPVANLVKGTRYYFVVKAYNTSGDYSAASPEISGVASDAPPSPPAMPAGPTPASGASGVSVTPILSWAASTGATQYAVAFGTSNPPAVVSSSQPATTYQPAALTGGTTYYWRIVATGAGGSTSGPIWSLTPAVPGSLVPVASYAFNEGTGTTTVDASGNGRTGTLTNATWTAAGKFGGALSFNGSSSRVTVADAAALHLSTAMTLEAWIKPAVAGAADWQAIIYKAYDTYFLATMPGTTSVATAGGTIGGGVAQVTGASALAANTWAHLAVTYDGATLRLFVNGAQVTSQPASGPLSGAASPLEIGGSVTDGGAFAGLIDDVRVYSTALTAAQIQTDMATAVGSAIDAQAPTTPTALVVTAVSSSRLSLSWAAATDNVGVTGYRLERCAGAGCTTSDLGPVTTTSYVDSLLAASTSYTYRVRATDAAANLSSASASASATTLTPPPPPVPTVPSGPTPVSGATGVALTPTLSWVASTNATQYAVAFGPTNPPAVVASSQPATTYQPAALTANTTYYWQIVATGAGGSTKSAIWSLTTLTAPTAPSGPTPVSGATGVSVTPTLSWAASTNATQYDVAFGTTNPPAVVASSQTATTYKPAALTASKKYFWRIVAKGAGGSTSGPVWTLTTTATVRPAPIAAYAFNESAGTTAGDASGNGRAGAVTNATWTAAGKYGGALAFNGSSSRVTVADAAVLHLATAMTLEAWVKPSAAGSADWQAILYKAYDAHFLATLPGAASVPTAGGTVAGGLVQVTGASGLAANTWTHVATTYDGATLRLFVNGALVASQPATGRLDDSSSPVEIGGSATDGGPFAGLIDDVRIYNTALTAAQIQSDMSTPIASAAPAAVAPATSDATSAGVGASVTGPPVPATAPAARAAADGAQPPLRLLTWNVNGGHNRAGAANVDAQVALMVSSGAQVIALQGVTISTAADLSSLYQWKLEAATHRPWNALWIPAPPALAPAHPDGNLLLTLLPIAEAATTVFDSAPMNPALRDAKRAAGWIAVMVNDVPVHIATTQLAVDATQRDAQLTQLDGWLATVPTPRLIGGDFQLPPTDAAYRQLASGFSDVWTAIGKPGPGLTQTGASSPAGRVDYWFTERNDPHTTPSNIWVIETSRSTHHAVVIDVTVQ